jgi:hypothetical protein
MLPQKQFLHIISVLIPVISLVLETGIPSLSFCSQSIYILVTQAYILWLLGSLHLDGKMYSLQVGSRPMACRLKGETLRIITPTEPNMEHKTDR